MEALRTEPNAPPAAAPTDTDELKKELQQLLETMYLPHFDRNDLSLENLNRLGRIMYAHNSGNVNFERAAQILKALGVKRVKEPVYF